MITDTHHLKVLKKLKNTIFNLKGNSNLMINDIKLENITGSFTYMQYNFYQ